MKDLAKRIQYRRNQLEITQEELAARMGVDPKNIYRYEKGLTKPPSETLALLAVALKTTPNWLLGFDKADEIEPDEMLILDLYRSKDDEHKEQFLRIVRTI
jgi:transcriptional regulator with XRE-family HTH domain